MSLPDTQRRAIAILRVSTDSQDVDRQKADIEQVKQAYTLTITRTVALSGLSGRSVLSNRDVQRVLADLKRPDVDGIAVSALHRLFRLDRYRDFSILDPFRDAGKLIFSAKEGALDPASDAGLIMSLMSGAQGGMEWRELRRRTTQCKELLRTRGGNPNGSLVLPRGIGSELVKNAAGRSIGARWFYIEPDASRIKLAYDLLFERRSWGDIAERIGGFTYHGVKTSLKNPIWKGVRIYRKGREEPLEVKLDIEPLISPERWEAAQKIILEKRDRWSKTKRPPFVLLTGLLRCACGKPCYMRSSHRSYYFCSSGFPRHGPKCGARSVHQEAADREVDQIVSEVLDAAFLRTVLGRFQSRQPARDQNAQKLARQREKLEGELRRLLRMTLKGMCTEKTSHRSPPSTLPNWWCTSPARSPGSVSSRLKRSATCCDRVQGNCAGGRLDSVRDHQWYVPELC
jgi:DNA invertase Pin-like site-specific DNA recombinase